MEVKVGVGEKVQKRSNDMELNAYHQVDEGGYREPVKWENYPFC